MSRGLLRFSDNPSTLALHRSGMSILQIGSGSNDPTLAYVDLSPGLERRLVAFHAAVNGLPAQITGGVLRMLYLSAGTIATLGIGDIVPTRPITRLLVTLESIMGVVSAGLFINSGVSHTIAGGYRRSSFSVSATKRPTQ